MIKMLIDTDLGDDIDDALSIAWAMRMPQVELIGLTTVFKNTFLRAKLAKKLLIAGGKSEIPVYAGHGNGIAHEENRGEIFCQYTEDLDQDLRYAPENEHDARKEDAAIDFMIESAKRYGSQLKIVCIGPLTNIALAIQKDAEAMRNVGGIVLMGGAFYEHFREWNILCDPEAAKIVFHSEILLECVGADVTWQCQVSQEEYDWMLNCKGDDLQNLLRDLLHLWKKAYHYPPVLHDPLAVWCAVAEDKQFLEMEQALIAVEVDGEHGRGMTLNIDHFYKYLEDPIPGFRISIAKNVKAADFRKHFMKDLFDYQYELIGRV